MLPPWTRLRPSGGAERWCRRRERAGWKPAPLSDEDFEDILDVADGKGSEAKPRVEVEDLIDLLD
jgi:hypothetical protein